MLLRNLNSKKGLCNGTRLKVTDLKKYSIQAEIISESCFGSQVIIPRIDLTCTDTTLPFQLKRRQFPIIPAYAVTINKSQGQTFEYVGINLQDPVFSHGQLYVALSRCKKRSNIKIFVKETSSQGHLMKNLKVFTNNIVFREIFQDNNNNNNEINNENDTAINENINENNDMERI